MVSICTYDTGVWQSFDQIDFDLREMKKAQINSIRVDFVWKHIEG
jgi:beta-galactosidase GanA